MEKTLAFVGLGKMGLGMAGQLLEAGFALRLYNRTAPRYASLVERGARGCDSPAEAARGAAVVVSMLADDAALFETARGERGFIAGMEPGAVHIGMSTVSVEASRRLAPDHRERGVAYVAAPVMGRPDVAAAGNLWIIAAGPRPLEERCRGVFEALGRGYTWLDDNPPVANAAKIAVNSLLVNTVEAIAEAFTAMEKVGGDRAAFLGVARMLLSGPFEAYAQRMLEGTFEPAGFSSVLALKDASLMLDLAREVCSPAPLAAVTRDRLLTAVARGRGDWDLSGLIEVSRESAGLA